MCHRELLERSELFVSGRDGYHTYRIPALVVSTQGAILAFCEGRKYGFSDTGKIDLVLKRSLDNGKTWSDMQVVAAEDGMTCGNPCPVVDRTNGVIWLSFCKNLANGGEGLITEGKAPRTVWVTHSADDGKTWAEPIEITGQVKEPSWTWFGNGPCHGIQLDNGRLVIPGDHVLGAHPQGQAEETYSLHNYSHVFYSDDHGDTWKIGGIVDNGATSESAVVQTEDGSLYISCRNRTRMRRRAYAWSRDNGNTFSKIDWDPTLPDPYCQGSLVRFTDKRRHDKNRILFSGLDSLIEANRVKLTIWISYDECKTWNRGKWLCEGPTGYSDLAVADDMTICCLYEKTIWGASTLGVEHPYEGLMLARLNVEWLTDGTDSYADSDA